MNGSRVPVIQGMQLHPPFPDDQNPYPAIHMPMPLRRRDWSPGLPRLHLGWLLLDSYFWSIGVQCPSIPPTDPAGSSPAKAMQCNQPLLPSSPARRQRHAMHGEADSDLSRRIGDSEQEQSWNATLILLLFQIISHSKNLRELKFSKFDQIYTTR